MGEYIWMRCVVDTSVLISKNLDAVLGAVRDFCVGVHGVGLRSRRRGRGGGLIQLLPELLKQLDMEVVDGVSSDGVEKAAGVLERGVNPGDALISAVAQRLDAEVVTRDGDWLHC